MGYELKKTRENQKNIKINPKLCLIFNSREQYAQVADFIQTEEIKKRIYKVFPVRFPYVIFDSEREQVINLIRNAGIKTALIDNIGHIDIAEESGLELFGNSGLNITNSYTLDEYKKMGFKDIVLSPELNFAQIRDIRKCINCGIVAYGRTHVMISENCLQPPDASRRPPSKGGFYLTDKTGARFFVGNDDPGVPSIKNIKKRSVIYNSVPVYLADKKELYKNLGLFFIVLNFTDEKPEQIKKIVADYALDKDSEDIKPPNKFTRGYK
jgi:putative protease